jgi:hypothetical protein
MQNEGAAAVGSSAVLGIMLIVITILSSSDILDNNT